MRIVYAHQAFADAVVNGTVTGPLAKASIMSRDWKYVPRALPKTC